MIGTSEVKDLELWLEKRAAHELGVFKYKLRRGFPMEANEAMGKSRAFEETLTRLRYSFEAC